MTDVTIPAFASGVVIGAGSTIGLKVQPSSDESGAYVPVVALDAEGEISIGEVTQGTSPWVVGPAGSNGVDYSSNAPSLSALTLLATIPANTARLGYFVQNQSTSALTIALDDEAASLTPTIVVLAGAATSGGQGAALDMSGLPHTGRVRIYSTSSSIQMAARAW